MSFEIHSVKAQSSQKRAEDKNPLSVPIVSCAIGDDSTEAKKYEPKGGEAPR